MSDRSVKDASGRALPETVLGLGVVLVALLALWQTASIPVSPLYSKVGPTIFPYIASVLLLVLGALLTLQGLRGGWQPEDEKEVPLDWKAMAFVGAGLFANVVLIGPLGFTIASTVMFTLIAWGFGSRTPWRDAPIGFRARPRGLLRLRNRAGREHRPGTARRRDQQRARDLKG